MQTEILINAVSLLSLLCPLSTSISLNPHLHWLLRAVSILPPKVTHDINPLQQGCHNLLLVAPRALAELVLAPGALKEPQAVAGWHQHVYALTKGMLLNLQLSVLLITTHSSDLLHSTNVRI